MQPTIRPTGEQGQEEARLAQQASGHTEQPCGWNVPNPMHPRTIPGLFWERPVWPMNLQRSIPSIHFRRSMQLVDTMETGRGCGN